MLLNSIQYQQYNDAIAGGLFKSTTAYKTQNTGKYKFPVSYTLKLNYSCYIVTRFFYLYKIKLKLKLSINISSGPIDHTREIGCSCTQDVQARPFVIFVFSSHILKLIGFYQKTRVLFFHFAITLPKDWIICLLLCLSLLYTNISSTSSKAYCRKVD